MNEFHHRMPIYRQEHGTAAPDASANKGNMGERNINRYAGGDSVALLVTTDRQRAKITGLNHGETRD